VTPPGPSTATPARDEVITETPADAGREIAPRSAAASAVGAVEKPASRPAAKPASAAAADGARFVVQVGAFAEAEAARETRARVEKLGMKTYTQVAQTPSGNRIRVRVGPFGSRAEADAALAKARAAGLTAVVLTL
jgi:DedD protein